MAAENLGSALCVRKNGEPGFRGTYFIKYENKCRREVYKAFIFNFELGRYSFNQRVGKNM